MVSSESLIKLFQQMYREHWEYEWGHHEKGCVDCSGAFVYAFGQLGNYKYPNGSNNIARNYTVDGKLLPISEAKPGMAAFKAKAPGESGYDLPDKYKKGSDLNDYYHIGLVDENVRYVLNAKGEKYGFCRDELTKDNGWDCVAYLKGVSYDDSSEEKQMEQKAKVVLPEGKTGNTVNMRNIPNTGGSVVMKVPVGSYVAVSEDRGQWCRIRYNNRVGFMQSNYLEYIGQDDETDIIDPEKIQEALIGIETAVDKIWSVIGGRG